MESYKCFLKCFSNGIGCEARSMLREHQKRDEKRVRSGKTRTLAIKKKITNKQTSENIYKLIPGRRERERERDTMYYNKKWIYFILHAVDLAASSIVASASVFPPSSNNNNNNIREYSGNCIMCSDLNRINARSYICILKYCAYVACASSKIYRKIIIYIASQSDDIKPIQFNATRAGGGE